LTQTKLLASIKIPTTIRLSKCIRQLADCTLTRR
jgi:hypothetical protein